MTPCGTTGPTVPAWVRERVAELEEAWPPLVLAAATAFVILAELALGVTLWMADAPVYYARP
jgi:hypothetical protein